jgi:hypothetical protein
MNAKNSRTTQIQHMNSAQNVPTKIFSDVARQQLALSNDAACALFRGSEAVRKLQQQAAHMALARHETAATRLREVHAPGDVMSIQSDLVRFDMEGAMQYWQQLIATVVQAQADMVSCARQAFVSSSQDGAQSAWQTWQSMVTSASRAESATSKAEAAS